MKFSADATRLLFLIFSLVAGCCRVSAATGVSCQALPLLPGTVAESRDLEVEQAYCAIDFSSSSVALCPKTWSTSPAMLIYDLAGTAWAGNAAGFENGVCASGGRARDQAGAELAMFKNSVNGRETSGTFAPASLLYYHFSRLLQVRVEVPVAVLAELPVGDYRQRIVLPGLKYSDSPRLGMLHAGWVEMDRALSAPGEYAGGRELLAANQERLWGVLLLQTGRRYGPEVNGTRTSGWGDGQNLDFQETAPYVALRSDLPLSAAIRLAVKAVRLDPTIAKALPADVSAAQMAWWMGEITEIVLLDFILRQQDRIGNIDYAKRWLWLDEGGVRRSQTPPAGRQAQKLRVSWLNDNDAGVRASYANYARRTEMLEGWHHMDPGLYARLQIVARELATDGELAAAIRNNYRLSASEARGIIDRVRQAAAQLQARCEEGELRFDLAPAQALAPEEAVEQIVDCKS